MGNSGVIDEGLGAPEQKAIEPLKAIVARFDDPTRPLDLLELSAALRKARDEPTEDPADLAEMFAFAVHPHGRQTPSQWGTYFGPFMTWAGENGGMFESPGRDQITPFAIEYWWNRAQSTKHPILRGRYSDLTWDLSRHVGLKPPIAAARLLIDCHIAACEQDLGGHLMGRHVLLGRALDVALSVRDQGRVAQVRDAIIALEKRTAADQMLGSWGFAFDQLLESNSVPLEDSQEAAIIADLELRLAGARDPFAAEAAGTRLARYYRRKQKSPDVGRVLRLYGACFESASVEAAPLVGLAWMERVHELYREFGLAGDAKALGPLLQRLGEQTRDGLHAVTAEVKVPRAEFDAFVTQLTSGSFNDALDRIAVQFLQQRGEIEAQIQRLARDAPMQALIERTTLNERGTVVCRIGSVQDDLEGRTASQMAQNLQISSIFLRAVIEHLIDGGGFTRESFVAYCNSSPLFRTDRTGILAAGVDAYLRGDHVSALHVLAPYIEDALRELIRIEGGAVYSPGQFGGLQEISLGKVLEHELVTRIFGADACFYLNVLLCDVRGLNVRNRVAHGLIEDRACSPALTDRLIHALLLLAQLRAVPQHATPIEAESL